MPVQVLCQRAFGELLARKLRAGALPEASGVAFWSLFGPQSGAFWAFFRASVAWCVSLAFGEFVVPLSFCFKDVRVPRANGAHADYIVKTNGFKHIFMWCFRAGERRGEQNTHGSGKKTHAKQLHKFELIWTFLAFFRSRWPNCKKLPK